ncbi:hypothetical protein RRG08_065238 [Elysia crispata]|uniref:Uncharacterized protein n=1 Tax=Elysia crispata TaxID=231223 RepID=A0AAE0YHU6_9GAST|nr:hypothetical protein RRG08_065238 [Elysia crispata]
MQNTIVNVSEPVKKPLCHCRQSPSCSHVGPPEGRVESDAFQGSATLCDLHFVEVLTKSWEDATHRWLIKDRGLQDSMRRSLNFEDIAFGRGENPEKDVVTALHTAQIFNKAQRS